MPSQVLLLTAREEPSRHTCQIDLVINPESVAIADELQGSDGLHRGSTHTGIAHRLWRVGICSIMRTEAASRLAKGLDAQAQLRRAALLV
jgi:hypothetical protein